MAKYKTLKIESSQEKEVIERAFAQAGLSPPKWWRGTMGVWFPSLEAEIIMKIMNRMSD